jgi:3-oxoacyl-[acyl-carrier-protein] synthase II
MISDANSSNGVRITGMGCLCSPGATVAEMMNNLYRGTSDPAPPRRFSADHSDPYPVFELSNSALPDDYEDQPESRRSGMLAIKAAKEALLDAGLDTETLDRHRVGVCIGTTVGNAMNNEAFYADFLNGQFPDMQSVKAYLDANPADMIAEHFNLKYIRQSIANACSSGAVAIAQAAQWITNGICDIAIAGGSDMLCRVTYNGFISLKITDTQPCRPFDKDRCGLNLGEGAGIVILESDKVADQRQVCHHATLCGSGNCSDAFHISAPKSDGTGLEAAIDAALQQAGITHNDIAFINAHGTATPENDKVEGALFSRLFPNTPFHSTKGYTGHTLGASGAIEAIISIEQLKRQTIAACKGFQTSDPQFKADPVTAKTSVNGEYALSDSVALGGNNVALIFKRGNRQ